MTVHVLCYCLCRHLVYWIPQELSFKNTAASCEGEKKSCFWHGREKKRDREVLRENGWIKLHREAGLLIWRKSFSPLVLSSPNMLYLSDTNTHAEYTHTHTHTPLEAAMLLLRGCMSGLTVNTQHITVRSHAALWCSCCSVAQCDLNPHPSM